MGIAALIMAISLSAFTNIKAHPSKAQTNYFWYDLNGNALNGGVATPEPSTDCQALGANCARGFTSIPAHPKTDPAQATRSQN